MSRCGDKLGDVECQLNYGHDGRHYAMTANEENRVEACSWDMSGNSPECYTGFSMYISDFAPTSPIERIGTEAPPE